MLAAIQSGAAPKNTPFRWVFAVAAVAALLLVAVLVSPALWRTFWPFSGSSTVYALDFGFSHPETREDLLDVGERQSRELHDLRPGQIGAVAQREDLPVALPEPIQCLRQLRLQPDRGLRQSLSFATAGRPAHFSFGAEDDHKRGL